MALCTTWEYVSLNKGDNSATFNLDCLGLTVELIRNVTEQSCFFVNENIQFHDILTLKLFTVTLGTVSYEAVSNGSVIGYSQIKADGQVKYISLSEDALSVRFSLVARGIEYVIEFDNTWLLIDICRDFTSMRINIFLDKPSNQTGVLPRSENQSCGPLIQVTALVENNVSILVQDQGYEYSLVDKNSILQVTNKVGSLQCARLMSELIVSVDPDLTSKEFIYYILSGFVVGTFDTKWSKEENQKIFRKRLLLTPFRNFYSYLKHSKQK